MILLLTSVFIKDVCFSLPLAILWGIPGMQVYLPAQDVGMCFIFETVLCIYVKMCSLCF